MISIGKTEIRWAKISLPKIAKTIDFCGDLGEVIGKMEKNW
jgi:hypothetical protein